MVQCEFTKYTLGRKTILVDKDERRRMGNSHADFGAILGAVGLTLFGLKQKRLN